MWATSLYRCPGFFVPGSGGGIGVCFFGLATGTLPHLIQKIVNVDGASGFKPMACPCCKTGRMITIRVFGANALTSYEIKQKSFKPNQLKMKKLQKAIT
jgi:hypothetical protein